MSKEGTVDFSFKLHGHKHTFQASTPAERDGWYVAIEKAIEEAKAGKEGVTSSPEYKDAMGKLSKCIFVMRRVVVEPLVELMRLASSRPRMLTPR